LKANDFQAAVDDGTTEIGAAIGGKCSMPRVFTSPPAIPRGATAARVPPEPPKPSRTEPPRKPHPPPNEHSSERAGVSFLLALLVASIGVAARTLWIALLPPMRVAIVFYLLSGSMAAVEGDEYIGNGFEH